MEANNFTSMSNFDRRLQEVEARHSAKKSSDGADAVTGQPALKHVIDRKGGGDGTGTGSRNAATVEHADGADRRALQQSGPSEVTDGASRSMGRDGGAEKGRRGKSGYIDGGETTRSRDAKVEQDGGGRWTHSGEWAHSNEPSGATVGASRLTGRGGGKTKGWWGKGGHYFEGVEQTDGFSRRSRPTGDTDGASRAKGRSGDKARGGEKMRGRWG